MVLDANARRDRAATRANVAIYGIDPRGLTDLGDESIEIGSFPDDTLARRGPGSRRASCGCRRTACAPCPRKPAACGGQQNDFSTALPTVVEDKSSYYVLAYYPPDARPGRHAQASTSADRPGLTAARAKAYLTPKKIDPPKTTGNSPSTPGFRDALDIPLPVSGFERCTCSRRRFKGTAPNASVLFGVELRGPT